MRVGLAETGRNGSRMIPTLVVVAAVAAGTVALLEFVPTAGVRLDTAQRVETTGPAAFGVTVLDKPDVVTVRRLRNVGTDIPRHWRLTLVRRTAPALAQWIGGMNQRLSAAGTNRVPAALHDRLALSFRSHG